mgnify:CR=1 FL=1
MSVMTGSGPLHKDAWPFPQKLVSVILSKLADVGGPRCCKRTSRIAIEEAIRFYRQFSSVKIPLSSVLCKYFEDMHNLFVDISGKTMDNISMDYLSMGMSADYYEAILCGANMVRIGSGLFGARSYT